MKSQGVARSYAKALRDLARERGQAERIGVELDQAADLVRSEAALAHFFARPGVSTAAKQGAAAEIAERLGVSTLVRDFLALVARQGRADVLPEIGDAYHGLLDVDLNRARARVRTAVALTDAERAALASRLGQALGGKQVALEEVVDQNLLGGFVAEIGSVIVDGSLDGQLARLKERLERG